MVAGVLLGPSLLGIIAPDWQRWLFPQTLTLTTAHGTQTIAHPSLGILYVLGQLGLVCYMFLIGLDLDTGLLRPHLARVGGISLSSIGLPLVLGGILGYALGIHRTFFPGGVARWQTALFLGCALSVTAFPVLARIIDDLGVARTRVGILALAAAAACDAAAWTLLAVIIAGANHSAMTAALAIGGGALYALLVMTAGRSLFRRLSSSAVVRSGVTSEALAWIIILLMLCAWYTDTVGIYSAFGAFLLGVAVPRGAFSDECRRLLESPVVVLLLPIYFVYSGLNTRVTLVTGGGVAGVAALILLAAFVTKGGGCVLASRLGGLTWREAASLGALMNARGVMELAAINIGLQKGLITPTLFTILVVMTIVTTLSAAPLFQLCYRSKPAQILERELEATRTTAP